MPSRGIRAILSISLLASAISGCQSSAARRQELNSTYAPTRARAVVASAEAGDATAVHKLVDLLEDEDRGVRMYAIIALRRLCGVDYGFEYYAPEVERQAAVDRWREAIRAGEVHLAPGGAAVEATLQHDNVSARANADEPVEDAATPGPRMGGGQNLR